MRACDRQLAGTVVRGIQVPMPDTALVGVKTEDKSEAGGESWLLFGRKSCENYWKQVPETASSLPSQGEVLSASIEKMLAPW